MGYRMRDLLKQTTARFIGPTVDHLDNRWAVICPACQREFFPTPTIFAKQALDCPYCRVAMHADYNAQPATVTLLKD